MPALTIALIGDHDPAITAHRAIPLALALSGAGEGVDLQWHWIPTRELERSLGALDRAAAIWCVPGSPYISTAGALAAIRHARLTRIPFLGTCAGFQHLLLEYADSAWGLERVAHAETDPGAVDPVIAPLTCSLVEQRGAIRLLPGSLTARAYARESIVEGYHCRYGLNPIYASRLQSGPLRATGWDTDGDIRVVELAEHPFFVGTLFQPERAALADQAPPLVRALVAAAGGLDSSRPASLQSSSS
jgi:CTP synthase (UTP-ammonia lyase)